MSPEGSQCLIGANIKKMAVLAAWAEVLASADIAEVIIPGEALSMSPRISICLLFDQKVFDVSIAKCRPADFDPF